MVWINANIEYLSSIAVFSFHDQSPITYSPPKPVIAESISSGAILLSITSVRFPWLSFVPLMNFQEKDVCAEIAKNGANETPFISLIKDVSSCIVFQCYIVK